MSLLTFRDISKEIRDYVTNGINKGFSTGWISLDDYWRLLPGALTIVTGIPSSGKSEFMDQLILHTIAQHDWKWTLYSPENWPLEHHFQKLAEKWIGKPMFQYLDEVPMSKDEINKAVLDLSGSIVFAHPKADGMTLDELMELVKESKHKHHSNAFIIDPWNECEHHRPKQMSETEYIGDALTRLRNFSRLNSMALFVVAHPTKLEKNEDGNYPVPDPYSINGSSNWRNKADVCVAVWRDYQKNDGVVHIHIQKMRNKNTGTLGKIDLYWHRANGLFFDTMLDLKDKTQHGIHHKKQLPQSR